MGLETILEIALWGVVGLARAMSFVAWLLIVLGLGIRDHIGLTRRGSIVKDVYFLVTVEMRCQLG